MSTDLEQRLRDALREDARRAHLFSPDGPRATEDRPAVVPPSPWRRIGWVAVAALALIALIGGVAVREHDRRVDVAPAGPGPSLPAPAPDNPGTLPEPGVQPADRAAAEAEVRAAFLTIFDTDLPVEDRAPLSERPAVWTASAHAVAAGPYWDVVKGIEEQVDAVVFTSPTHAVVSFEFLSPEASVPRYHVGDALRIDGRWVMAIDTSCQLFAVTGNTCDLSL